MIQRTIEDLINKKSGRIFYDGEWRFPNEFVKIINDLESQRVENSGREVKNSIEAKEENAYNYIEYYLKLRNEPQPLIDGVHFARRNKIGLQFLPSGKLYEYALIRYVNRTVIKPRFPGYTLSLFSEAMIDVIREVVDYNENGYVTRVVPRKVYNSNPDYYNNKIKNSTDNLTIGDCYKGSLLPLVPEFNKSGQLVGYYSECLALPKYKDFRNIDNYHNSEYSRVFGCLKPYLKKTRLFSLKIVDESPFPGIIIPAIHRYNAKSEIGDTVYIQVYATYQKNGQVFKYGDARTKDDRFEEYLLWQLNFHFFLRYDLKKWKHNFDDLQNLIHEDSFKELLKTYRLASNSDQLEKLNKEAGEQNNGVLINKLLLAQMAILYN